MEQSRPFDVDVAEAALAPHKTETAAGGPWNNCRPFNAKLAPDATLMGGT
jgi:hypothetical protein